MYNNLSDFFDDGGEKLDPSFASIDVLVTPLILTMKHRLLMLFKLILLERKVSAMTEN